MKIVKRIYKVYKKYNPDESLLGYFKRHIGQVVLALMLSLFVTGIFCFDAAKTVYNKHGKDIETLFYTDDFDNTVWGIILILIPMLLCIYSMFRFGGTPKGKKIIKRSDNSVLTQIIIILTLAGAGGILRYSGKEIHALVNKFILNNDGVAFLKFIGVLLFVTFGAIWEKLIIWLKSGGAYKHPWFIKCFMAVLTGLMGFYLVEMQMGTPPNVVVKMMFFNIMYWTILYTFLYAIFRGIKIPAFLCIILAYILGLANYVVLQFRGNYIMFGDLTVVGTAMEVAGRYKFHPDTPFFVAIGIFVVFFIMLIFIPRLKRRKIKPVRRIITTLIAVGIISAGSIAAFQDGLLYNYIFGLSWNYNQNVTDEGYLAYFFSNMHATSGVKVEGYSDKVAKNAVEEVLNSPDNIMKDYKDGERFPTIIVIQNETFADLSVLADIKTDKPVMPFINSLKKNTVKGYVNMSVTGGPTANTEFEFLTRSSMAYMPTGSVPYTQYLKQNVPSLVEVLKHQSKPYLTTAFHPYYSSGYNRRSVYEYIGFDNAVFYEDFKGKELLRGLITDKNDYKDLIEMYEKNKKINKDQPQFFFNVTMQNHGGFSNNKVNFDEPVKITNFKAVQALDNFVSLMKTSDTALIDLIGYFKKVDEPVIILFYGDHQPSFSDDATKQLDEHSLYENDNDKRLSKFVVPYFIWANYDIPEYDGMHKGGLTGEYNTISVNYLASMLLKYSGVELSDYDKYLLNIHQYIPAMSALGYWDSNGKRLFSTHLTKPVASEFGQNTRHKAKKIDEKMAEKLKKGYENVQYNLIFDAKNKLWDIFLPQNKELKKNEKTD